MKTTYSVRVAGQTTKFGADLKAAIEFWNTNSKNVSGEYLRYVTVNDERNAAAVGNLIANIYGKFYVSPNIAEVIAS